MTKNNIIIFILFIAIFAGTIFWYFRGNICQRGITFRIASISPEYNVDESYLISVIDDAADIWEAEIGYSVFSHDENGRVDVNLLFDERQKQTINEQEDFQSIQSQEQQIENQKSTLERDAQNIERLQAQHSSLVSEYNREKAKLSASHGNPAEYNRQVALVNSLASRLNSTQDQLSGLIDSYNARVGSVQENVSAFNANVGEYNQEYTGQNELFDKGDYGNNILNLYQYEDRKDLVLLVAHELGHVLGIDHVQNTQSLMHYTLEDQNTHRITLSAEDKLALMEVCGS